MWRGCPPLIWQRCCQVKSLSTNYRCTALDLPGHGKSAMPAEPTIEAQAKAVRNDNLLFFHDFCLGASNWLAM